jgi:hypothetical protein
MLKALVLYGALILLAVVFNALAAEGLQAEQVLAATQPDLQLTGVPLPQAGPPKPVFLQTVLECQNNCYDNFQSCKTQNPFSICWQIYTNCRCSCNDSCNP